VGAVFANYHVESAAESLQVRIARTRLHAMEQGVPYALTYQPEHDQFWTWACEPLEATGAGGGVGTSSALSSSGAGLATTDAYDRRYFSLNHKADSAEFRFLGTSAGEVVQSMGMGSDVRSQSSAATSAEGVAASPMLSPTKRGLVSQSTRSLAALQVPGLQLAGTADPIVFEPDGTADKDSIIRIASRENRYVEITVHAMTGAITTSPARLVAELPGAVVVRSGGSASPLPGGMPSRPREIRSAAGGAL
jgi:hypothetical protein